MITTANFDGMDRLRRSLTSELFNDIFSEASPQTDKA
uniref:Uncharacterized protein n=1 Tax=Candidatus Kentrum sp. FW TaxID=2126338 RepID=A0A450SXI7_9GAMM|nr:MAG: hypothetical protein BECKFW1821B_GA0114236_104323 [Candidatus Kentron sp. FW]VFJ60243.1 MAG: hypothetical protein BECKFW1821A_GA0114235_11006 [Candidatus Kentron sp. FW]